MKHKNDKYDDDDEDLVAFLGSMFTAPVTRKR